MQMLTKFFIIYRNASGILMSIDKMKQTNFIRFSFFHKLFIRVVYLNLLIIYGLEPYNMKLLIVYIENTCIE